MSLALWIVEVIVALVFAASGLLKSTKSREALVASGQTGVQDLSLPFIRFIAACELLGAVALVAPRAVGVAVWLTPLAATGLAIIMIGAAVIHARLKEPRNVVVNAILFAACGFIVSQTLAR
jgi:hypothetical protein